jgi:MFS family permease
MTKKRRYFYGWNIVLASFLARLSYAQHFSSILGLFFQPLQNEFGWSRSALAGVQTTARVIEAAIAPLLGPLIDRYGPRVLMPAGSVIVGLAMLGATRIHAIWQFYLFRGVIVAFGFTLMGGLVSDVAINNWFVRKRGRALAISRIGGNISNILIVPVSVFIIAASGWRAMFVLFAVLAWIVVFVPSAVLMRRRPEDLGLHPDGDGDHPVKATDKREGPSAKTNDPLPEPVWNRREVLATGTFWILAGAFAVNSMSFQGINISLAPLIQDQGYTNYVLALALTLRSVVMIFATLGMGFLAEKADTPLFRGLPFLILSLGAGFFLFAGIPAFLWLAIFCYALGASGVNLVQEVLWAGYFGRLSLGLVRSLSYFISFGLGAAGPLAMNIVYDLTGTYRPAFLTLIFLFIGSAILVGRVRPAKAKRFMVVDGSGTGLREF